MAQAFNIAYEKWQVRVVICVVHVRMRVVQAWFGCVCIWCVHMQMSLKAYVCYSQEKKQKKQMESLLSASLSKSKSTDYIHGMYIVSTLAQISHLIQLARPLIHQPRQKQPQHNQIFLSYKHH